MPEHGAGTAVAGDAPARDRGPSRPGSAAGRPAVLVINPDLPRHGSRFHEFINTVALAEGFEAGLVTQSFEADGPAAIADLERHGVRVFAAVHPPVPPAPGPEAPPSGGCGAVLRRLFHLLAGLTHRPAEVIVARRTQRTLAAPLREALAERRWDRIVIVQSQFAEWIDLLPAGAARVLVLHDLRTVSRWRAMKTARNPLLRLARLADAARTWAFERGRLRRFDRLVCLTEVDARLAQRLFGIDRGTIDVVPIPVDGGYFQPEPRPPAAGGPVLLFPGRMSHPPNVDAAVWFTHAVFPLVRRRHPDARLVLAGENPPPAVTALARVEGVTVTGSVPDMRPHFAEASAVVVPLRIGSGARNKILEAWSCGRPVVSTAIGAEGLDAADGRDLRLADGAPAFAAAVCAVLERPDEAARLVEGGARAVRRHAPGRVGALYRQALAEARPKGTDRLRVAIDLRWMVPGSAGGLEQTARAFLETLLDLDAHNRHTVILPAACRWDFDRRARPNLRFVSLDTVGGDLSRAGGAALRRAGRLAGLPVGTPHDLMHLRRAAALESEVALSFAGYINPDLWTLRNALLVPDIQHEYHPDFFSAEALAERRRLFGGSIARADAVCAISDFTRTTLVERLGVPAERIDVAHLAPASSRRPGPPDEAAGRVRRAFGLEAGRYLFFPAHTWHHKNHRAAIEALALLRDRHSLALTLACTGGAREAQPSLDALVAERGLGDAVRFLGYVDEDLLPALYQSAAALVFPSRFEGFGMPVAEAMACGCPVVCSDTTSLPEVAGDAALLVDPDDPAAIAEAVRRLVTDPGLRADLVARGFLQARRFSWRAFTLTLAAAVRRAASSTDRPR